jgi:hypothetical protein
LIPLSKQVQWNLDLRKPDLRKNLDLRNIVATTDFLAHKLFDLRNTLKIFLESRFHCITFLNPEFRRIYMISKIDYLTKEFLGY